MNQSIPHKALYILPNGLTTGSLLCGFYSIMQSTQMHFHLAIGAILLSLLLDGLDGRIARITRTESRFGAEYDSLADLVAFGLAPAFLLYHSLFYQLQFGWLISGLYAACTAMRLARFNTTTQQDDGRFFTGLPSPSAAALIASYAWMLSSSDSDPQQLVAMGVMVGVALLMVSPFKYYGFKKRRQQIMLVAILLTPLLLLIGVHPGELLVLLFGIFVGYALSGPLFSFSTLVTHKRLAG